jgi:hypothetical protein
MNNKITKKKQKKQNSKMVAMLCALHFSKVAWLAKWLA